LSTVIEKSDGKDIKEDEQALSYITRFRGWKLLKEYADRLKEELDQMVIKSIENGATAEEIGQRTMVKELAKAAVDKIISKAEYARKAEDKE
jgi:hypothetical protein